MARRGFSGPVSFYASEGRVRVAALHGGVAVTVRMGGEYESRRSGHASVQGSVVSCGTETLGDLDERYKHPVCAPA